MKTPIILILTALCANAQQPFVHSTERKTNVQHVAASGVIAAHTITTIAEIAAVGVIENGQFKPFDQPAIRLVSQTTNLVTQAQKPLLSEQSKQPAEIESVKKSTPRAAAKIPGPPKEKQ